MRITTIFVSIILLLSGCEKRRQQESQIFVADDSSYVLTILLDLSGSFQHQMCEGGHAHRFMMQVLDFYFRDRIGTDDKLIIAQISAEGRSLLWQGTPLELRRDFPSATAFAKFLRSKSDAAGSLVYEAIANTTSYVISDPNVSSRKAKSAIFILSDMLDTSSNPESLERALKALSAYGQSGGVVGIYYVDQRLVSEWRTILRDAGISEMVVESEIVGKPNLPHILSQ